MDTAKTGDVSKNCGRTVIHPTLRKLREGWGTQTLSIRRGWATRRAIQALKLSVARRRAERPFWQARYYDFNVRSREKVSEKLRYMHRNPVARGLVESPEQWAWSSYRHYASGERGTVEIESAWTAAQRGYELPEGFDVKSPKG